MHEVKKDLIHLIKNKVLKFLCILFITISTMVSDLGTVYTASWYGGDRWNGRKTASGEVYNDQLLTTAASKHYKMYDLLLVTNVENGKSVQVYVNDRGAFEKYDNGRRRLDLSKKAFQTIAPLKQGVVKVTIEVLNKEETKN